MKTATAIAQVPPRAAAGYSCATLVAPRRWEMRDLDAPTLGPREVLIRLEGCGVCGSNLPAWEGQPWFSYPLEPGAPGHEGWGAVEACGAEVSELKVGDRVAALSYRAFATHDVAAVEQCVALPPQLDGQPFPGEPLACAFNVFRRCGIEVGQSVAVVGVGFLGALLTGLASRAGARVTAVSRRKFALEMAERFGADWTATLEELRAEEGQFDCVIEATGAAAALELCSKLVQVRGRLVIAGYHQDGPREINLQEWNWKGIDIINAHEREPAVYMEGMRLAVAEVVAGRLDPRPLYTHQIPLPEISRAFEVAHQRPEKFMKALVRI